MTGRATVQTLRQQAVTAQFTNAVTIAAMNDVDGGQHLTMVDHGDHTARPGVLLGGSPSPGQLPLVNT